MSTPMRIVYKWERSSPGSNEFQIHMRGGNDQDSYDFISVQYPVVVDPMNVDEENYIFASLQDGLDFYTIEDSDIVPNSQWIKYRINNYNAAVGGDYVLGELTELTAAVYEALALKADKTTTVNGHALSGNVSVTKSDIGLGNVDNTADSSKTFTASQVSDFSTSADARITAQKGAASGICPLDSGSKIDAAYLPNTVMEYKGAWNANTNSPSISDGTGNAGDVYRASAAATRNLGSGNQTWAIGDLVIYNGTIWQHSPAADGVSSVFTRTGAVTAQSGDYNTSQVTENTNLYYTNARAQAVGGKSVLGTTVKSASFPIFKEATVSSGTAVFHLTADGTSGGTALFTNVYTESVITGVSDATASYQMSWAFTNSNKTLTVTANKLTTSNILTGILGQAQANGAVVKLQVWGD